MMNITVELNKLYFTESKFKFNLDKNSSTYIQEKTVAKLYRPKDEKDKTAMLEMKITITSVDKDDIYVEVTTHSIFSFSEIPEDYDYVSQNMCIPKAQKEALDKIDNIIESMGYPRFNLSNSEKCD